MVLAAAMLLIAHSCWAYDFSVVSNGKTIYYNITRNISPYTVEVTDDGNYYGNSCYSGGIIIPSSVTYSGRTYSVSSIGISAFENCSGLTSVTIPNSVTQIEDYAFNGCTGLTSVTIPNSITYIGGWAFSRCTGLTSVSIPNSVTSIFDYTFYGCTGLTSVTIPNLVTQIWNSAFEDCTGLTSVTIPNSITYVGLDAFLRDTNLSRINYTGTIAQWGDIDFQNDRANPLYYGHNLYINNQLVTNLVIPNTVDTIKRYAFTGTCITSVSIPNSVTYIGDGAFYFCTGLRTVNFNADRCKYMGKIEDNNLISAFGSSCTSLTTLNIGNNVEAIPDYAFSYCRNLCNVNQPGSLKHIGDYAFAHTNINNNFSIGNNVRSIGYAAFWSCRSLTHITIPDSVRKIGAFAFYSCNRLTTLTIGKSVDTICENAFGLDTSLTTVYFNAESCHDIKNYDPRTGQPFNQVFSGGFNLVIGENVRSIPSVAFYGITLTSVTIGSSVKGIGPYAFSNASISRTNYTGTIAQWCNIYFAHEQANPVSCSHNLYINNQLVTNLIIPNTVDTIKQCAFVGDNCLTSVSIPNSVTSIGGSAFTGCTGLTSVTFRRANTMIENNSFNSLPVGLPIHIPCGSSAWYINKLPNFSNFIEELQYSYSVTSQDTLKGTVATVTAPTCNTHSWTISATANTGYTFSCWSDGNTQNPRTLTVTQDTVLVASFTSSSQQWYNFNVVSEDVNKGTVQVLAQPSQANPQATFVALPNNGYTFSRWSDGNTQNPRSITVTQDTILIAFFTSNQGIAETENASITLYPNPASDKVTLEGVGNEANIFIINAMGKVVRRLENAGGTLTFSVGDLPKGIYFVRVSNAVRKLVID